MSLEITLPPRVHIKAGGVITCKTDPGGAVYWDLVGVNHETGSEEAAHGSLKWNFTRAGNNGLATNIYYAPTGSLAGHIDRIYAKAATG